MWTCTAFLPTFPLSQSRSLRTGLRCNRRAPHMVFTGIVEETGTVTAIRNLEADSGHVNLTVDAKVTLNDATLGDSISVNGTCLTITEMTGDSFTFGLAPETLRRTNLGDLANGDKVNLERSVSGMGRFGGHVVQGHVDCVGSIVRKEREKESVWFWIKVPKEMCKYLVEKGYVAVDGASLTVCEVNDDTCEFSFMMIEYTQEKVVTAGKQVGENVNIEVDIMGKYVERIVQFNKT